MMTEPDVTGRYNTQPRRDVGESFWEVNLLALEESPLGLGVLGTWLFEYKLPWDLAGPTTLKAL